MTVCFKSGNWLTKVYSCDNPKEGDAKEYEAHNCDIEFITQAPSYKYEGEVVHLPIISISGRHAGSTVVSLIDTTAFKLKVKSLEFFTPSALPSKAVVPKRSYTLSKEALISIKNAFAAITAKDTQPAVAAAKLKQIQEILSKEREAVKVPAGKKDTKKPSLKKANTSNWEPLLAKDTKPTYS